MAGDEEGRPTQAALYREWHLRDETSELWRLHCNVCYERKFILIIIFTGEVRMGRLRVAGWRGGSTELYPGRQKLSRRQ